MAVDHGASCVCPCDCDARTPHPSRICYTCREGAHRPAQDIRAHLAAGGREWTRLTPTTGGSSGGSPKQIAIQVERWRDWHGRSRCPLRGSSVVERPPVTRLVAGSIPAPAAI